MTIVCSSSFTLNSERGTPCHLMRAIAKFVPVIYINPPHSYYRWRKVKEQVKNAINETSMRVVTPILPTTFRFLPRRLRRRLVTFLVMPQVYRQIIENLAEPVILWSYLGELTPILYYRLKPALLCYHRLDDYAILLPKERHLEKIIENKADLLFVVSPTLQQQYAEQGQKALLLPNGVDVQHFAQALLPDVSVPEELVKLPSPRIGFVGTVDPAWVDTDLLLQIAQSRPNWSVIVIGPLNNWSPPKSSPPNCYFLGARPYQTIPFYLKGLDVCLIPFKDNAITNAASPLKLYEYLAAGRAVVSSPIPDLTHFLSLTWLARTKEEFVKAIEDAIKVSDDTEEQRRRLSVVTQHSWEQRAKTALLTLQQILSSSK